MNDTMNDKKIEWLRIIISTLISTGVAFWLASHILISLIELALIGVLLICFGMRKKLSSWLWQRKYKKRLNGKKIGILYEDGHPSHVTTVSPFDWCTILKTYDYFIQKISYDEITDDFIAIINPYGEVYREDDYTHFETFNRIKEYVRRGGIFVSAGGLAFWWAWDKKYNRLIPTAKEIYGYQAVFSRFSLNISLNLIPSVMIGAHSLIETLTNENFKLLTTANGPTQRVAYQTPEDKKFCGDIENVGGTKNIVEFRAAREPLPKCYPMLRADTNRGTIYPILAIPHGKGIFIFSGVSLDYKKPPCNKSLVKSQIEKIAKGVDNIIKNKVLLKIEKNEI